MARANSVGARLESDIVRAHVKELAQFTYLRHKRRPTAALPEVNRLRVHADFYREIELGPTPFLPQFPDRSHWLCLSLVDVVHENPPLCPHIPIVRLLYDKSYGCCVVKHNHHNICYSDGVTTTAFGCWVITPAATGQIAGFSMLPMSRNARAGTTLNIGSGTRSRARLTVITVLTTLLAMLVMVPATSAQYDGQDLIGANFSGQVLTSATFDGANLSGADFSFASLNGATFNGANLSGATFLCADLTAATFDGATLAGTIFTGAIIAPSTTGLSIGSQDGTGVCDDPGTETEGTTTGTETEGTTTGTETEGTGTTGTETEGTTAGTDGETLGTGAETEGTDTSGTTTGTEGATTGTDTTSGDGNETSGTQTGNTVAITQPGTTPAEATSAVVSTLPSTGSGNADGLDTRTIMAALVVSATVLGAAGMVMINTRRSANQHER